jgi:outer membrane protein
VPDDIEAWSATALEQNLSIIAAQHAVDSARAEVRAQFSGHLPNLDLVARYGYDKSGGRFGGTKVHADSVGLQLNVPLWQSGFVASRTREASHRVDESLQRLEFARRSANRDTRVAYLGVVSGISQVQAYKQALVSAETAMEATQAGFEVGTRTAVDVVTAERFVQQSRRDYARARYTYIVETVRLKRAAGILTEQDLTQINSWLN